jgi:spore germination cell wall hydrolase CwlJ-like protein
MVFIRNARKIFLATCIVWAVFVSAIFAVKVLPIKSEKKIEPKIITKVETRTEIKFVYVTKYKDFPTFYNTAPVSSKDREILARLVYLEARNQPEAGQRGIVEVVLNRVLDKRFPNTVHDVVYQKNQFSTAPYINRTTPTQKQYRVVDMVLREKDPILSPSTVYFSTFPQTKNITAIINDHYFCS